jgi:hypothetical protein
MFVAVLGHCWPNPLAFNLRLLHQQSQQQSIEMLTQVILVVVTGFDAEVWKTAQIAPITAN